MAEQISKWKVTGIERHSELHIRTMEEFVLKGVVLKGIVWDLSQKLLVQSQDLRAVVESNPELRQVMEENRDFDKIKRDNRAFFFKLVYLTEVGSRRKVLRGDKMVEV